MPAPSSKIFVSIQIDEDLLTEATRSGTDLSEAAESGIRRAVAFARTPEREARREAWELENAEAIESSNEYVRKNGLPLARYRMF